MNKEEYLLKLKSLLNNISEDEKQEALDYYKDYIESAKSEEEAIADLGSPELLAKTIVDSLHDSDARDDYFDYTNTNKNIESNTFVDKLKRISSRNGIVIILIIAGLFILSPILGSFVVTVGSILFALFLLSVTGTVGFIILSIYCFVYGLTFINSDPSLAVLFIGGGFLSLGVSYLPTVLCKVIVQSIPKLIKLLISSLRKLFNTLVGE